MDVSKLSDVELREALVSNGINPGPIGPTTRLVYEKKLSKVLNDDDHNVSQTIELNISKVIEQPVTRSPVPQVEIAQPIQPEAGDLSRTAIIDEKELDKDESDEEDYEGEESMRYLTEEEIQAERKARKQNKKSNTVKNIGIFAIAFGAIAVFAYFLLENTEMLLASMKANEDDQL
ncbi:unnamed protein product [Caenorhabditis bovis]|uniref:LEM domain-containing protein n=1 Tax=Caenorhabditis bovis TaxID=2654633 RepID=A0A8S1F8K2_9PELO|nr:unnamed protein product [Caenorhabditis bovis]